MADSLAKKHAAEIQREILGALSTQANRSVAELASLLQLRPHVVRYNLQILLEDRRINSSLLVNHRALGYSPLNVFFDLPTRKEAKALAFLESRPEVWWLTCVTGPRRFEATFTVEGYEKHAALISELGRLTGTHLREPIESVEVEMQYWGLRFLVKRATTPTPAIVHFRCRPKRYKLDDLDYKVVSASLNSGTLSLRHIAESLKIPQTTLKYRLDKLVAEQVISERLFFVETSAFFMQAQLVLNLKARGPDVRARVVQLCEGLPNVEGLLSGVGNWDYKVVLAAESFKQLLTVERTILNALARDIYRSAFYLRERVVKGRASIPKQSS